MPVKKHFINRGLQQMLIEEYLQTELAQKGFSGCELQKTPMGTRITIQTARPGQVIGPRGKNVKELTEQVKARFNINVPTIDVETLEEPELNAQIQAEKVAYAISQGQNYRRATYGIIRRIMNSGARGVEIAIGGKVTSQRARSQTFRAGIISKCGTPSTEGVDRGVTHCVMKSGVLGIRVKIMPLSYQMPDEVKIRTGIYDEKPAEKALPKPVDAFYKDKPIEEKIEDIPAEADTELFDDTTGADEVILAEIPKEEVEESASIIDEMVEAEVEKPKVEAEEEKPKKKMATKKKTTKKINLLYKVKLDSGFDPLYSIEPSLFTLDGS